LTELVPWKAVVGKVVWAVPVASAKSPAVAVTCTRRSAGQDVEVPFVTKILYTPGLFVRVGVTAQPEFVSEPYTEWSLVTGQAMDTDEER
jgi:hypothetical protein